MNSDERLIVCGLGRCGTSLMMQILDAGGFPVNGSYPAYEDTEVAEKQNMSLALRGHANKVLDPHRYKVSLSSKASLRCIFLVRNVIEQAKSNFKFLKALDEMVADPTRAEKRAMERSLNADNDRCIKIIRGMELPLLTVSFESLLSFREENIEKVFRFIGHYPTPRQFNDAIQAVIPRDPKCLPYMLEFDQIKNLNK